MGSYAKPPEGGLSRRLRELWPDANPLRRRSDRAEARILGALCAVFLASAPVVAVVAGSYVYAAAIHAQHTSHPVTAILLSNPRLSAGNERKAAAGAIWKAPDGAAHLGTVLVPAGTSARSAVRIWVDGSGHLTGAPLRGASLAADVAVAALLALAALGVLLLGVAATARWVLQRRRLAAWDADWRSTEPQWT